MEDVSINKHPNPEVWWKHRRAGYYTGIRWGIIQTFLWGVLAVYDKDLLTVMSVVIAGSYGLSMTLVVAYYGNTAVEEWMRSRSS